MKKLIMLLLAAVAGLCAQAQDSEWVGIGTGAYQPGILDAYGDEYPDLMAAAVYKSSTREGVYKFIPSWPSQSILCVYEIVVHAADPEKVWCENANFFRGIMNFNTCHKVSEANPPYGADPANYGKLSNDGAITFTTPGSFMAMEMMGYAQTNLNGNFALFLPGASVAVGDPTVNDTWESAGMGKYVEGLLDVEYTEGVMWEIEYEKSVEHPGVYRVKPYYDGNPSCPFLPEIADTYIYIHAENPDEVYTTEVTFLNSQGKGYKVESRAALGEAEYFGSLADGVITFPVNSHYATVIGVSGMGRALTNTSGKAAFALPGADLGDYYVEAIHPACANNAGDGFCNFPFMLKGGKDVAAASIAVEAGALNPEEVDAEYYAVNGQQFPSMFFNFQLNMNFPMAADQFNTNRWTMIIVALDAFGTPKNVALTTFFTPEKDSDWEDYAHGDFTDLLVSPVYYNDNPTYPVTIQRRKGTQGQLRVVNPISENPVIAGSAYLNDCSHSHYLYINADDPDFVYIEESPLGCQFGYGDVVASSPAGNMINQGSLAADLKSQGIPAGSCSGDDFYFPAGSLQIFETKYKNMLMQEGGSGFMLHITDYSGIENVAADAIAAPARCYDLRGIEIANPAPGQVCIEVKGDKASKVRY